MPRKNENRLTIVPIGEWYTDLLAIDAAINARTPGQQAASLLCSKLQEREQKIRDRVQYLADKRGITFDEMWQAIARGEYKQIAPDRWDTEAPENA